ncbi:hypothetical protein [Microbacterium enclense]|uniref:hypothetical protein n=1 Tax=Microbacterium enclense TaxID=993073 RepID=UPI003F818B4F
MTRLSTSFTASGGLPQRENLRRWLAASAWAIDAHGMIEQHTHPTGVLVTLPLWAKVDRHETRIRWRTGTVVDLVPGEESALLWCATEGDTSERVAVVTVGDGDLVLLRGEWPPTAVDAQVHPTASLTDIVMQGEMAEWELLGAMEPFARRRVEMAGRSIAGEIGVSAAARLLRDPGSVIDGLTADRIVTQMIYGRTDGLLDSVILRMIRSFIESHSDRVPVTTYFEKNVTARADERVRQAIGDPGIGRLVRRVARMMPASATNEDVLAECRRLGIGNGKLSLPRVEQSLNVAQRIHTASDVCMEELTCDAVVEDELPAVEAREVVRAYSARTGITDPDNLWLSWNLETAGTSAPELDREMFYLAALETDRG